MKGGIILFLSLFIWTTLVICQEYKTVNTCSGPVKGIVEYKDNKKIYNFRGIPYAKAPVGDLRFRKPKPIDSWVNTLDATRFGAPCVQPNLMGPLVGGDISEDCLYLNIYVPQNISTTNNMAVMVWIHGGGYGLGEGAFYDGTNLAIKGGVIVVTFNYRLGVLGFLNTNDKEAPGNFGLWDQIMAFKWVQSNIEAFGGNPSAVTIFGQSAGAMSVSFHTIIPYNKGLFQRAIVQSGTVFSSPVLKQSDNKKLMDFVNGKLNCTSSTHFNTTEFVLCLKQKSFDEINNLAMEYIFGLSVTFDPISIAPSIDGDLIIDDPDLLLSNKNSYAYNFFRSLDYMVGTTDGEASHYLATLSYLDSIKVVNVNVTEGIPKQTLCKEVSEDMARVYFKNSSKAAKTLCDKYTYHGNDDKMVQQGMLVADVYTDLFMIGPTVKTLKIHEDKNTESKTYQYFFTRAISWAYSPPAPWFTKASHGTELAFLFGGSAFNVTFTKEESLLEDTTIEYWSNFAKTGNPNSASVPTWDKYGEDKNYIQLDLNIRAKKDLFPDRMKLILEDIPKLIVPPPSSSTYLNPFFVALVVPLICCLPYIYNFIKPKNKTVKKTLKDN